MQDRTEFYINGAWVKPRTSDNLEVIDPATEEPFAVIALASKADVDMAVGAARAAFPSWSATSPAERKALLQNLLEIMRRRNSDMGELISREMGAPIDLAIEDQAACGPAHLAAFIAAMDDIEWEKPFPAGGVVYREPIGVCGLITPWNWPMNQIALKVIPALATGCTCVLKPSEIAPLSALLFAEMIDEAGFPAGVFNLVNGDGAGAGTWLSGHEDVDMMSFTGSTRAGILVSQSAAQTIKRVTLELGGKSPNLIFADADLDAAIAYGVANCFENSGQSCNAPTRMLVERSIYDEAVERAAFYGAQTATGNPRDHGNHIGPVVSQTQYDRVQDLIQSGIDEQARLLIGGPGKPEGFNRGYYVRPTIFADVAPEMRLYREEVFGPVLAISPFEDEDRALAMANDTPYGLSAYIQTKDAARAERVAKRLRAGIVRVNSHGFPSGHPFGGYKQSGNGREGGIWGLEEFLETKIAGGW